MFQFDDWDNYAYDYAARNSIDVGTFLGLCLAELSDKSVDILFIATLGYLINFFQL